MGKKRSPPMKSVPSSGVRPRAASRDMRSVPTEKNAPRATEIKMPGSWRPLKASAAPVQLGVCALPHREASMNPSIMFVLVADMHVRLCPQSG